MSRAAITEIPTTFAGLKERNLILEIGNFLCLVFIIGVEVSNCVLRILDHLGELGIADIDKETLVVCLVNNDILLREVGAAINAERIEIVGPSPTGDEVAKCETTVCRLHRVELLHDHCHLCRHCLCLVADNGRFHASHGRRTNQRASNCHHFLVVHNWTSFCFAPFGAGFARSRRARSP